MESKRKVAIVTGASKGIGAGIARGLAQAGYCVVVNYASSRADADRVVADIERQGGTALAVQGDVSRQAEARHLVAETVAAFGRLDVLVNNAGVCMPGPLAAITAEDFRRSFDVNVLGLVLASQAAACAFDGSGGAIINIASAITRHPSPGMSLYSASKAAVESLTRDWAHELGAKNIRVNAILPGMVLTEGAMALGMAPGSEFERMTVARTPLGRAGQPQDIAAVAVFLASDASAWITGETITASGGA